MAASKFELHITMLLHKIYSNGYTYVFGIMLSYGAICSWSYAVAILGYRYVGEYLT